MRALRSRLTRMPALPSGASLTLHELDPASVAASGPAATEARAGSLGGRVWNSAAALCRWQLGEAATIAGARVLELGGGTGACGLFAAGLGASAVVLTDGSGALEALMARNVEANRAVLGAAGRVSVERLRWGIDAPPRGPFDWVLASDVTPYCAAHGALGETLRALLAGARERGEVTRVVMCEEHGAPQPAGAEAGLDPRLHADGRFYDTAFDEWRLAAADHSLLVAPLVSSSAASAAAPQVDADGRVSWAAHAFAYSIPFLTEVKLALE